MHLAFTPLPGCRGKIIRNAASAHAPIDNKEDVGHRTDKHANSHHIDPAKKNECISRSRAMAMWVRSHQARQRYLWPLRSALSPLGDVPRILLCRAQGDWRRRCCRLRIHHTPCTHCQNASDTLPGHTPTWERQLCLWIASPCSIEPEHAPVGTAGRLWVPSQGPLGRQMGCPVRGLSPAARRVA